MSQRELAAGAAVERRRHFEAAKRSARQRGHPIAPYLEPSHFAELERVEKPLSLTERLLLTLDARTAASAESESQPENANESASKLFSDDVTTVVEAGRAAWEAIQAEEQASQAVLEAINGGLQSLSILQRALSKDERGLLPFLSDARGAILTLQAAETLRAPEWKRRQAVQAVIEARNRLEDWLELEAQAPEGAPPSPRSKKPSGRPAISEEEVKQRWAFANGWARAKEADVCFRAYCGDAGIAPYTGRRWLDWARKRRERPKRG